MSFEDDKNPQWDSVMHEDILLFGKSMELLDGKKYQELFEIVRPLAAERSSMEWKNSGKVLFQDIAIFCAYKLGHEFYWQFGLSRFIRNEITYGYFLMSQFSRRFYDIDFLRSVINFTENHYNNLIGFDRDILLLFMDYRESGLIDPLIENVYRESSKSDSILFDFGLDMIQSTPREFVSDYIERIRGEYVEAGQLMQYNEVRLAFGLPVDAEFVDAGLEAKPILCG